MGKAYLSEDDDTLVDLEPFRYGHKGSKQPRCQSLKKRVYTQCPQASRRGFDACHMHGAGTQKRVQKRTLQNPATTNITTGLYAKTQLKTVFDLREMVHASQVQLDNTDEDIATLKAVAWYLLQESDTLVVTLKA